MDQNFERRRELLAENRLEFDPEFRQRILRESFEVRNEREKEFWLRLTDRLNEDLPRFLDALRDPGMADALVSALSGYSSTGDRDLAELLVEMLIERSQRTVRDLVQIALGEAIGTAPKLTLRQIDALSLVFLVKYVRKDGIDYLSLLDDFLDNLLAPFATDLTKKSGFYLHLQSCGCCAGLGNDKPMTFGYYSVDDMFEAFSADDLLKRRIFMEELFDAWKTTELAQMTLTPVGVVLAVSNIKRVVGRDHPLSVYIP